MEPLVSIIITTRNEEKNILNCLESVNNQTYKKIEILVVDNFSIDNTKKTSLDFFKKKGIKNFKFCDFGNERSSQRNFGAQKANGKYYLYLDADMILFSDYVEKLTKPIIENKALGTIESIQYNVIESKNVTYGRNLQNVEDVRYASILHETKLAMDYYTWGGDKNE